MIASPHRLHAIQSSVRVFFFHLQSGSTDKPQPQLPHNCRGPPTLCLCSLHSHTHFRGGNSDHILQCKCGDGTPVASGKSKDPMITNGLS